MQPVQIRKIPRLTKWSRFALMTLPVVATCIWPTGTSRQLQAGVLQTVEVASSWQQASFPVESFQGYTSAYGYRISPVTGQRQFHRGIDIAAPMGSYVRSWWAGQIVELSDHTGCGTMVTIQSGPWQHIYCHLNGSVDKGANGHYLIDREGGVQLWEGQQIPLGARIARVGMTGQTTGPHLHWGLKYSGQYIDPAVILREMYKQANG